MTITYQYDVPDGSITNKLYRILFVVEVGSDLTSISRQGGGPFDLVHSASSVAFCKTGGIQHQ